MLWWAFRWAGVLVHAGSRGGQRLTPEAVLNLLAHICSLQFTYYPESLLLLLHSLNELVPAWCPTCFETGPVTEPGSWLAVAVRLVGQQAPGTHQSSLLSAGATATFCQGPALWVLGIKTQAFMFMQQTLYTLNLLTSPMIIIIMTVFHMS